VRAAIGFVADFGGSVVDAYENLHNVVSKTAEVNNGASISAE
jgi:hypothetical protein